MGNMSISDFMSKLPPVPGEPANLEAMDLDEGSVLEGGRNDAPRSIVARTPVNPCVGFGDQEIKEMLAEVDLLSIIKADTGEQGHGGGERIDFNKCPVCGHRDCFSYYPASNSWACFGASNQTGYGGGTALEYYKATRRCDDAEAVKWLREETGHPYDGRCHNSFKDIVSFGNDDGSGLCNGSEEEGEELRLPPWNNVRATNPPKRNPPLIHGIVRRGHVMLIGGKGKGSKTWTAIELSVAVAVGGKWFGFDCEQGRVLYIDPEMDRKSLDGRFHDVAEALYGHVPAEVDGIVKWCLRGALTSSDKAPTIEDLSHDIEARCSAGGHRQRVVLHRWRREFGGRRPTVFRLRPPDCRDHRRRRSRRAPHGQGSKRRLGFHRAHPRVERLGRCPGRADVSARDLPKERRAFRLPSRRGEGVRARGLGTERVSEYRV